MRFEESQRKYYKKFKPKKMELDQNEILILVETFNNSFEANIAQGKLKDNGIISFTEEENVMGLNPLGGTELKVYSKDLKIAKEILSK